MPDPFIIMSAPNGARRQKTDHPALPITPNELADCAVEIRDAGASVLHLHVRDEQNRHSLDVDRYRAAIAAIRAAIGNTLIIQVTSEAVGHYTREEQMHMVKTLRPQAVSLALRELCPTEAALPQMALFVDWMSKERVMPQYILYDDNDRARFERYLDKGVFQNDAPFVLFVLGQYQSHVSATNGAVCPIEKRTEQASFPWAVCGFGKEEAQAVSFAAKNNGHIRVGFENNICTQSGALLKDHAQMVAFCVNEAKGQGRAVATSENVKNLLNL